MMRSDSFQREGSKPFDSATMDRSVIAIPLLHAIEEEVGQIEKAKRYFPGIAERFTAAIFYNPAYPGGLAVAEKRVRKLLAEAIEKSEAKAKDEIIEPPPKESKGAYSFTRLSSRVSRKLLALNRDLEVEPIGRVIPTSFEVIIDLNLDFPDGREIAKAWVTKNIALAKEHVGVSDEEQGIHEAKIKLSNQYVFARLEGRVIKESVRLDVENARRLAGSAPKDQKVAPRKKMRGKRAVEADANESPFRFRTIYRIWPDFPISA